MICKEFYTKQPKFKYYFFTERSYWAAECFLCRIVGRKKAFDTVWIKGLLYKLCCMGMSKILWANIYDSYDNFKCAVI